MKTIWGFPEEEVPAGEPGSIQLIGVRERQQQAEKLTAVRVQRSPWFIIIWEKLTDGNVPGRESTRIWCCYSRRVIFYKKPWVTDATNVEYQRWAEVDTALGCDDVVLFENEYFEVGTGQIVWYENNWWCRTWARRK